MLLFSFCLTVCVLPVSAGVLDTFQCVVNLQPQTFGIAVDQFGTFQYGFASVPASFNYSYAENINMFSWQWDKATALTDFEELVTMPDKKIEFIVNVGNGESDLSVSLERCAFDFLMRLYQGTSIDYFYYGFYGTAKLISDNGDVVYQFNEDWYDDFPVFSDLSFTCSQYFSIEFLTTSDWTSTLGSLLRFDAIDQVLNAELEIYIDDNAVSLDSISIQISDLKDSVDNIGSSITDIGNDVGDIKATVENIQGGVVEINGTVTDMKEQLEEPDSPIWSAAGEKISDTLTDLFVPDPQELADVKQGFDNLAKDKLGGAYTAMETVDDAVKDVSNKLHSPNSGVAVRFPGISVPLGGEVGTVELARSQPVIIPTELTAILHPLAGTIFSFICGFGTLNVLKDMVECFLSGYSYAEYIHRNKGGSDQ